MRSSRLRQVREIFRGVRIETRSGGRKPIVGVVEIYVRSNRYLQQRYRRARRAARRGGVGRPVTEWVFYTTNRYLENSIAAGRYVDFLKGLVKEKVQKIDEARLLSIFDGMLLNLHETGIEELLALRRPLRMHHTFGGEAILTIGKAIDYILKGASGIVNAMPFTCMPGMVSAAVSRTVRERNRMVPWLNMTYDGQKGIDDSTRIEAFMHQARAACIDAAAPPIRTA